MNYSPLWNTQLPRPVGLLFLILLSSLFSACGSGGLDVPLDTIDLDLRTHRLDEDMYAAVQDIRDNPEMDSMQIFQKHFKSSRDFIVDWMYYGQDSGLTDNILASLMYSFVSDSAAQTLLDTFHTTFSNQKIDLEAMLTNPLKRFHYYFPNKAVPSVVTFADGYPRTAQGGLDQLFLSGKFIGIGLHYFMGPSFKYYPADLPKYIRRRCTPEHLSSLVVHRLANGMVPKPKLKNNPVLLDYVIHEGIKMYFVDKVLGPMTHDTLKLFYTAEQLDWAQFYEGKAYLEMMENLYDIDAEQVRRYVEDSPFTSQLNRGSAPRLGQFLGWKIVSAYMEKHPEQHLDGLIQRDDYQQIFKKAKYRPAPPQE
ncbi:MAG TPA: hypothetical protein ENJ82_01110 [Bacteroidetes bacterium]|nr:hypothetical protein [Bacteroidota bacterium]